MADQLLSQVQDLAEGQIDFHGQRLAETLATVSLIISGIIALVVGHVLESIHLTLYVGLAGTLLTVLLVVPPWPFYNQHPEPWLSSGRKAVGTGIEVDGKKIN